MIAEYYFEEPHAIDPAAYKLDRFKKKARWFIIFREQYKLKHFTLL